MAITDNAKKYHEKMLPGRTPQLQSTDPEFVERFMNFAFDEVIQQGKLLDEKTRFLAILATLLGCQGLEEFKVMVPAALHMGVTPVEVKEIVYQATAYLGIGRVFPFLKAVNEIFTEEGIALPLEGQATTTMETRREAGTQCQVEIFGEGMRDYWKNGPEDAPHINYWLAAHCFGDWYTRGGLDLRQREMITFCYISAQGGCEPQLIAHAQGNMNVGNDKAYLIEVVSQMVPYIGYPRSLNAMNAVRKAAE